MLLTWGILAVTLLYLEIVYHISGYGFSKCNPIFTIFLILVWSAVQTVLVGIMPGYGKKILFYAFLWFAVIWTAVQVVYLRIFKQPLLWEAAFRGGGDALTNYWRETLDGIIGALPILAAVILPAVVVGIVSRWQQWEIIGFSFASALWTVVLLIIGIIGSVTTMQVGKIWKYDYYEDYQEFFDPMTIAENMGIWPMFQRDTETALMRLFQAMKPAGTQRIVPVQGTQQSGTGQGSPAGTVGAGETVGADNAGVSANDVVSGNDMNSSDYGMNQPENGQKSTGLTEVEEKSSSVKATELNIDYEKLHALADNKKQKWLADYIEGLKPVKKNQYTGMFEGYNLIFLTAEGFSTNAIREDLTPTLYRLTHSGFVFENYYVPLWQTSTSDGEYINCTGLIPDGQFSMKKSVQNNMAFTLPRYFEQEGVYSYAYHNNSLTYYDRYLTHPNLGYDYRSCKLGNLSAQEWGDKIFPMDHPNSWPASDLEMMQGTVSQYVNQDRFHVYYLTVSGHMNYNFKGNAMSAKNRDAVANLPMSENGRAYIACNIELDKALEYLLKELEAAGKLENTVICLSADHYPYAMTSEQYEELAGKPLSEGMDLYRNSLILWNAGMEDNSVVVKKACGSMDIIPTLLNLFGFSYDSGLYAGRDILSDEEGLVIFNDRSFVTDGVIYKRKEKETIWLKDAEGKDIIPDEAKEAYLAEKKQEVKDRYQFSAYILQENYYEDIKQALR